MFSLSYIIIGGYSKNDKGVATQIVSAFYVPATYNNILISNLYTIVPMPTMLLYVIGYVVSDTSPRCKQKKYNFILIYLYYTISVFQEKL